MSSSSLIQNGMSLKVVAYFHKGMSLNADKGIDHVRYGDRHERSEVNDVGATAGVSGRDDRDRVLGRWAGRQPIPAHRRGPQPVWLQAPEEAGQGIDPALLHVHRSKLRND